MQSGKGVVHIYTDGSCINGYGGWSAVLIYGNYMKTITGSDIKTTSCNMEVKAVIGGLSSLNRPCKVELYSDFLHIKTSITENIDKWKSRNWRNHKNKKLRFKHLWIKIDFFLQLHEVNPNWVKAHNGNVYNELAHNLAYKAAKECSTLK